MAQHTAQNNLFAEYAGRLQGVLAAADWSGVGQLAQDMHECWLAGRQVFLCGNGGSAGNAIHLANDLLYGIAKRSGGGMKVTALSANSAVITCLANDLGYEHIFSGQLAVQAQAGDLLIALSGSGNSPNIVGVIEQAKVMGVKSYAVLGYSGGKCKYLADVPIHFPVDDMQIAEDLQLIVGHMLMQWLYTNRPSH
ncbi:MAG: phosphoheptose isomerase [Gallionellales bacterium RIFCSPHIGHO2_02_FULL_57_16]|nr:MAG: phosphoheptose isomerase [Gallionellales bacterium RIFCSPHIGHO2_02_FULL_57_16]